MKNKTKFCPQGASVWARTGAAEINVSDEKEQAGARVPRREGRSGSDLTERGVWGVAAGLRKGGVVATGSSQALWAEGRSFLVCPQFSEEPRDGLCRGTG